MGIYKAVIADRNCTCPGYDLPPAIQRLDSKQTALCPVGPHSCWTPCLADMEEDEMGSCARFDGGSGVVPLGRSIPLGRHIRIVLGKG